VATLNDIGRRWRRANPVDPRNLFVAGVEFCDKLPALLTIMPKWQSGTTVPPRPVIVATGMCQ
jgi:hypothetical protein